jgi:hypothetical protein
VLNARGHDGKESATEVTEPTEESTIWTTLKIGRGQLSVSRAD